MADLRSFLEEIVYQGRNQRRFTQQSPVMPDVWLEYGALAGNQLELLLVPDWNYTPAKLAAELKNRLKRDQENESGLRQFRKKGGSPKVAFSQNVVVARLWFDQLIRIALPLSHWWHKFVAQVDQESDRFFDDFTQKGFEKKIFQCLKESSDQEASPGKIDYEIIWLARIAGIVSKLSTSSVRSSINKLQEPAKRVQLAEKLSGLACDHKGIAKSAAKILNSIQLVSPDNPTPLFRVNLNRFASTSLHYSVPSVKADAASRVFKVSGKNVRWAVLDSGIDARHYAFRKRDSAGIAEAEAFPEKSTKRKKKKSGASKPSYVNNTRIKKTYDFMHIRDLLAWDVDSTSELTDLKKFYPKLKQRGASTRLKKILLAMEGSPVNWEAIEEFIEVPKHPENAPGAMVKYVPGGHHGTHVAGILAADWRVDDDEPPRENYDMIGICPGMELYDIRVLDDDKGGDEFAIICALQFIRYLNDRTERTQIHGVNLSFSIQHDVANYACGRTPVCDEAELLVKSGLVVVAAAGNSGRARYITTQNETDDGFRTVSITDPGNAVSVITVGSTHRIEPHTYGVSYFSSRGPTGDGRSKPDLVAPGERILSCAPDQLDAWLDGTSMAAPHVSGAIALLLDRYPEFIGQPEKVKEIICKSATDLGREKYYQGAGLLDILRAMQSI